MPKNAIQCTLLRFSNYTDISERFRLAGDLLGMLPIYQKALLLCGDGNKCAVCKNGQSCRTRFKHPWSGSNDLKELQIL